MMANVRFTRKNAPMITIKEKQNTTYQENVILTASMIDDHPSRVVVTKTWSSEIPKLSKLMKPFWGFFIILPQRNPEPQSPQQGSSVSKSVIYIMPTSLKHLYLAYPMNIDSPAMAKIVYEKPSTIKALLSSPNEVKRVLIMLLNALTDEMVLSGRSTLKDRRALKLTPELSITYGKQPVTITVKSRMFHRSRKQAPLLNRNPIPIIFRTASIVQSTRNITSIQFWKVDWVSVVGSSRARRTELQRMTKSVTNSNI